ncbi:MAG: tRNA-binding protein [Bacteroidetes bacterium]|nr:tRNA-binding protein [Bacteroidota bacterium]
MIDWKHFESVEIRCGTVIQAETFPEARKPAIKLWIDFGEFGIKKSSAQITELYDPQSLLKQQVIAVLNFPPKQIGPFISECLVLGVLGNDSGISLLKPDYPVKNGLRIG